MGLRDLAAARRTAGIRSSDPAPLAKALKKRHAILVTGGTGFVGSRLVAALVTTGHHVTVLTRARAHATELPAPIRVITSLDQLADDVRLDAIVNLAGEPIANGLWTKRKRRRILRSRLELTRAVIGLIGRLEVPPSVLINGSAVGWYGMRADERLDETAAGTDCLSRAVCVRWERAAFDANALGVRVVCLRTGLVLAAEGGILSRSPPSVSATRHSNQGSGTKAALDERVRVASRVWVFKMRGRGPGHCGNGFHVLGVSGSHAHVA